MSRWGLSGRGKTVARASALALLAAIAVAGCTSTLSNLPLVGEPDTLPQRPGTPGAYPAVHDMPAPRDTKPLTEAERKKLEADLVAARNKQEADTNTVPPPLPPKPSGQ
jgi:hypothetical protein